jgi:phosphatidylserine/phosphatidylglycerophosphate/cardiolipin synthase-like enzyme
VKLIIEPDDGAAPLLTAIKGAKKTIEIAIFRLDRKDVEIALKTASEKGVQVTALIASANRGGEQNLRNLELRFLEAGIVVVRTSDDLVRYHDKYMIIDRRTLYVFSTNLTRLDTDHSRGFGIVTTRSDWVTEARRLFRADCGRTKYRAKSESLVVSPSNARNVLGKFLQRAKKELLIYDPKIDDKEMGRILQDRKKAGVAIRVIGTVPARLQLDVQRLGGVRLHTRTIIRDRRQAFIGSQSLKTAELDSRRELGLIVRVPKIVKKLVETFESDWDPERSRSAEPGTSDAFKNSDVVDMLAKDLDPIVSTVKKAVKKAVAKSGEDVLHDKGIKSTMKRVVKKAVKDAVHEAVQETQEA